jgi:hypothetical protein
MLKRSLIPLTVLTILGLLWQSCTKTEQLKTAYIKDYHPIEVGKYITYKLDSTLYINLNTEKVVRSYIIQDLVDAKITDNLGRDAFRIRRLIRSNTDTTQWSDNTSYIVVPLDHSLEMIENNLRYIKLQEPIRENFSWKGNNYINTYSEPDLQYLDAWEYNYGNVDLPYSIDTQSWPETITVTQRDEVLGTPGNTSFYWEVNHSVEVYSKGIGLVFKDFLHEAWQPPNITCAEGCYESNGYGVRLTFLNSNY